MPFKKSDLRGLQHIDAKKIFVGRTGELNFFVQKILEPDDPSHNIISISGQGGVGKSTLINHFMYEANSTAFREYCLTAKVDERQTTPASIMEKFASQFRESGHPLKKFEEALTQYKEALRRTQVGQKGEQEIILRETVDLIGTIADDIPIVGGIIHKGSNTVTEILLDKSHIRQFIKDSARLEDPIRDLTKVFVKDLNQIADTQVTFGVHWTKRQRRVILFFDTFEQLTIDAAPWLLYHFLEADVSANIVLVIAGRDSIELSMPDDPKLWFPYIDNNNIYLISLNGFTEQETRDYLKERGITDSNQVSVIWELSRGLPLYLGMLTSNPEGRIDPTAEVVDNFLRWIPKHEHSKRQLALDASLFSMPFNQDDLTAFTYLKDELSVLYNWLIGQSFIKSNPQDGRHIYHDLAQNLFSRHLQQRSQEEYDETRHALANYYRRRIEKTQGMGNIERYQSSQWQELVLALVQQLFLLPDENSHIEGIGQIVIAYEQSLQKEDFVRQLRLLSQEQFSNQPSKSVQSIIEELLQYIENDLEDRDQEVVISINHLLQRINSNSSSSTEALAYLYRRRGYSHRILEKYNLALDDYNKALVLAPSYANAVAGRAITYRVLKDYKDAINDHDRAIEMDPDSTNYSDRGVTYLLLEEYPQAITDFNKAIELDPNDTSAYANRGEAHSALTEYQLAITDFSKVIELAPDYARAYTSRGVNHLLLEEYPQAITDFNKAIELDPNDASAYANRGEAHFSLEEYQLAITDFSKVIELAPDYARAYTSRGVTYLLLKEYPQAITDFNKAIELDPNDASYANRGEAYRLLKEYPQAITDFNKAIELDPNDASTYASRGEAYRLLEEYPQAITDFSKAIELAPNSARAYTSRGVNHLLLKEYPQAITDFNKAIELDPNDASYANRGEAYRLLKEYPQAITDFNKAIELDPNDASTYANRGEAHFSLEEYQLAITDFSKAIELAPNYAWTYASRGGVYLLLEEYQLAIADFSKAIELDPNYAWTYASRGEAYSSLKEHQLAIADFSKAIELDPNYAWTYKRRGRAYRILQEFQLATNDYNRAIELEPTSASSYLSRGYNFLWQKDIEQARRDFARSCQLDPTNINYCWMIEFVDMCQKKPDLAEVERLERIANLAPQNGGAYRCRGIAQFLRGELKDAMMLLKKSIALNPGSEDNHFWYGMICAYTERNEEAVAEIEKSLDLELPPVLLAPLNWLKQDKPQFYEKYVNDILYKFK